LARFTSIWHVDFEFREDANHHPAPVCMYAYEQHTGRVVALWRYELLRLTRSPIDAGPSDLMVAYAANAELSCFRALNLPFPRNVLDLYVEASAAINGRSDLPEKRPSLLEALALYGLPVAEGAVAHKAEMRDLILNNTEYSPQQRRLIMNYNKEDVDEGTVPLLNIMAAEIDLPRALYRGRYVAAVTLQEWSGLPLDVDYVGRLITNWRPLQLYYIRREDVFGLYDDTSFVEKRLAELIHVKSWDWQHTKHGRLALDRKTLARQARRYPELARLVRLRNSIAELRISSLVAATAAFP
jgi:hypothetical protein